MRRPHFLSGILCYLCALGTACLGGPSEASGTAPVVGPWSYSGVQNTGVQASTTGMLVFTASTATSYGGSLDVIESVAGGQQRRLVGAVSGRMSTSQGVDFDVTLGVTQRHHIGTVVADTISGTWFELAADNAVVAGGTYRAVRSAR